MNVKWYYIVRIGLLHLKLCYVSTLSSTALTGKCWRMTVGAKPETVFTEGYKY
jgi:hypothetical protein